MDTTTYALFGLIVALFVGAGIERLVQWLREAKKKRNLPPSTSENAETELSK
jgi:hypothetical protein